MTKRWVKIPDHEVAHFWTKTEDDDCGEGPNVVDVSPDWYADNGTPICQCGREMEYSHTEIKMYHVKINN